MLQSWTKVINLLGSSREWGKERREKKLGKISNSKHQAKLGRHPELVSGYNLTLVQLHPEHLSFPERISQSIQSKAPPFIFKVSPPERNGRGGFPDW